MSFTSSWAVEQESAERQYYSVVAAVDSGYSAWENHRSVDAAGLDLAVDQELWNP
jgi:hypothetical protein